MSFENKVILITGGSSGIGAATAVLFTKEKANVVIVGRNEEKLQAVSKDCEKNGKVPYVIVADVSKDEDAERIILDTVSKYGKIDVLVNNAGVVRYANLFDSNLLNMFDEVMNINLRAVVNLTSLAAPHLIETKGNIVNVSSIAAQGSPLISVFVPYSVSKAALDHFSRGAALELASKGVRVNVVSPGPVKTDIQNNAKGDKAKYTNMRVKTPLGRIGESDEIADVIIFLASEKAKGITGSVFVSDNGYLLKKDYVLD